MSEVRDKITNLKQFMESRILGQEELVRKLIITMLADGHALVEGAPGLAKTKAIKTLSECIEAAYSRIQFTPDLLPSDITGSDIYVASTGQFEFRKGPIFANLILADEINRAPAKVQSALLEAMAERQVSVGGKQYKLPKLFMVMATQNPIEHEGTYNLPEAQLDRFLMYIKIDQPEAATERKILQLVRNEENSTQTAADSVAQFKAKFGSIKAEDIFAARQEAYKIHCSDSVEEYLIQLIMATRHPEKYDESLKNTIAFGASPRATIALDKCAKINAWLAGRDFVTPEDVHAVVYDVLRHRIILSFEAQASGLSADDIITRLLKIVPLP
ncbi:MAG: MoxR family ATPase [Alphaproteobacteria bacterium]|nr:MoxR family ATPase [Alphaproteobacteria bacterium]